MSSIDILKRQKVEITPRVVQVRGLFDMPVSEESTHSWSIEYDLPEKWNIGLIIGPSGAGKSTVAQELFGEIDLNWDWPEDKAIIDGFPDDMTIQEVTGILSSVGFSSPPSWLKPYSILSTGEKFRVDIARTLAENQELSCVDEFTSVIDRTVAKVGSAAIAKAVRRRGQKFVAVSCHYDIIEWLEPDWIIEPHLESFDRRCLRRPKIDVEVNRVSRAAWGMFKPHHYLTGSLNPGAKCFVGFVEASPAVFTSMIKDIGLKSVWRGHRTVCLPDYQGVGLGMKFVEHIAAITVGAGYEYRTSSSHPAIIHHRSNSDLWDVTRKPNIQSAMQTKMGSQTQKALKMMASFRYVGPGYDADISTAFWQGK